MKKSLLLAATAAAALLHVGSASAAFLDGYLGRCTATGTGTCTEMSGSGYARQPISFSSPTNSGAITNSIPYTFGSGGTGNIAGVAVYDAATGGNLLLVIPFSPTNQQVAGTTPAVATRDIGTLKVSLPALATGNPSSQALILNGATAVGTNTSDGGVVSTGIPLTVLRGTVSAAPLAYALAGLPATTPGLPGREVFCTDCRKPGEAAGAGTGVQVFDDGKNHWVSTAGTVAAN